jgi:hypothetical protein
MKEKKKLVKNFHQIVSIYMKNEIKEIIFK